MFEIIAIIAVILAIAIAIVLILAATKPDTLRVQRATTIKAPAGKDLSADQRFSSVGSLVALRAQGSRDEAHLQRRGERQGRGLCVGRQQECRLRPHGNPRSSAPSKIVIKLDFFKPFEGHNTAEFTMLPQGDATNVTWLMHGPAPFMSKVMQVFMNIDNMIGKDFEAGLANLKKLTEK